MIITHFDDRKHESCIKEAKRGRQERSHCNGKYPGLASQGYGGRFGNDRGCRPPDRSGAASAHDPRNPFCAQDADHAETAIESAG